jgi:transcriptional regulator with XRE-family HTH domain
MYKSYRFTNKDPIIDRLRTIIADQGATLNYIERKSGVCANTLRNWFHGKTKRPQHATVAAVAAVLGYHIAFVKHSNGENVTPIHARTGTNAPRTHRK